jgi:hypothetical protein
MHTLRYARRGFRYARCDDRYASAECTSPRATGFQPWSWVFARSDFAQYGEARVKKSAGASRCGSPRHPSPPPSSRVWNSSIPIANANVT